MIRRYMCLQLDDSIDDDATFGSKILDRGNYMKKLTVIALLVAAIAFQACSSTEEKAPEAKVEAPKAEVAAPAAAPAAPAKAPAKKKK